MRKTLMLLAAAALALSAMPAEAAKAHKHKHIAKHKKMAVVHVARRAAPAAWGAQTFPPGPLYFNGGLYLGDDPDPNIRFQLWRDISGRLGGEE